MRSLIAASILVAGALALPQFAAAQAPTGNAPFCLKGSVGAANCMYQTMAQCDQAKKTGDQCLTSEQARGTVGQGSQQPGSQQRPPASNQPPASPPAQPPR